MFNPHKHLISRVRCALTQASRCNRIPHFTSPRIVILLSASPFSSPWWPNGPQHLNHMFVPSQPATSAYIRTMHIQASHADCVEITMIEDSVNDWDLAPNGPWGFAIYRVTYGAHTDASWARMLELLAQEAESTLRLYGRIDALLPRYQPVVMDNQARFEGFTSHEVRDHFKGWAADELEARLAKPLSVQEKASIRGTWEGKPGPDWGLGARYNFCLFVDDICLESLERMRRPVVKLLWKQWGPLAPEERNYAADPNFEDGQTECEEEDVGWMYVAVDDCLMMYGRLCDTGWWGDEYRRPPGLDFVGEGMLPGFWRKRNIERN